METLVQIDNVRKIYKRDQFEVPVLNGITVEVDRGDFLALMGPSGSARDSARRRSRAGVRAMSDSFFSFTTSSRSSTHLKMWSCRCC